mmetsp:Transcript_50472/g.141263  ORF Transcript_50472/g.141263 Transcript_50472/m.141263 type:complete len:370 (+) Transcript_50472:218-1327(+)
MRRAKHCHHDLPRPARSLARIQDRPREDSVSFFAQSPEKHPEDNHVEHFDARIDGVHLGPVAHRQQHPQGREGGCKCRRGFRRENQCRRHRSEKRHRAPHNEAQVPEVFGGEGVLEACIFRSVGPASTHFRQVPADVLDCALPSAIERRSQVVECRPSGPLNLFEQIILRLVSENDWPADTFGDFRHGLHLVVQNPAKQRAGGLCPLKPRPAIGLHLQHNCAQSALLGQARGHVRRLGHRMRVEVHARHKHDLGTSLCFGDVEHLPFSGELQVLCAHAPFAPSRKGTDATCLGTTPERFRSNTSHEPATQATKGAQAISGAYALQLIPTSMKDASRSTAVQRSKRNIKAAAIVQGRPQHAEPIANRGPY